MSEQGTTNTLSRLGRRLWCALIGHRMYVWQELTAHSRRVVCDHCGGDWGMNDDVRAIIPWDAELESLYQSHGIRIRRRP